VLDFFDLIDTWLFLDTDLLFLADFIERSLFSDFGFDLECCRVFLDTDLDCYLVFPLLYNAFPCFKVSAIVLVALNCFWAYDFYFADLYAYCVFFIKDCFDTFEDFPLSLLLDWDLDFDLLRFKFCYVFFLLGCSLDLDFCAVSFLELFDYFLDDLAFDADLDADLVYDFEADCLDALNLDFRDDFFFFDDMKPYGYEFLSFSSRLTTTIYGAFSAYALPSTQVARSLFDMWNKIYWLQNYFIFKQFIFDYILLLYLVILYLIFIK